ncbi:MAG: hypothetical protein ACYS0F_08000, partial [Planctomycetota bacterium]
EEIIRRQVTVNCTDLQVARELFESGPDHIREGWADESAEIDSRTDWDSGTFWPEGEPPNYMKEGP